MQQTRLLLASLAIALAACGPQSTPSPAPDDGGAAAADAGVRAFLETIPAALAAEGPLAWLRFFEDGPSFFMASDGKVVFPDRAAAETFLATFAQQVASMALTWENVQIEPLAPDVATVAMSYHERITMHDGTVSEFGGYVTGVARGHGGAWRLQHLHWSSPVPDGE